MSRREIEIAVRCMIIDSKARHVNRHYAILPSPTFLLCEFVVSNPLDCFTTSKRLGLHLRFASLALDDRPKESKSSYPSKSSSACSVYGRCPSPSDCPGCRLDVPMRPFELTQG